MSAWCMAHPWLTFWLLIAGMCLVAEIIRTICKVASE